MLGLLVLIRDSLLAILMTWAGMDGAPEKQDDTENTRPSSSIHTLL